MRYFDSILLLFLFINSAHSEIIDGPSNVRELETNKVLISLFDGIVQDAARIDENHFKLQIWGISKIQSNNDFITLFKGDTVYSLVHVSYPPDIVDNINKIPIGIVINNLMLMCMTK